jgi:adenosylhomocysteine nucleosidase
MSKIAIIAALEREIRPLVRAWSVHQKDYDGRAFRFYENGDTVVVCGGIGAEAARRAAQAVIALYTPQEIYSAGFAGAATDSLKIADILVPRRVINANDGSSVNLGSGEGILVSLSSVATPEQKAKLAAAFGADAIDMEAAAVARAAQARGVRFASVKAISDASDFKFPVMDVFISPAGQFHIRKYAFFVLLRPWLWEAAIRLARNSAQASRALSSYLRQMIESHVAGAREAIPTANTNSLETFTRQ